MAKDRDHPKAKAALEKKAAVPAAKPGLLLKYDAPPPSMLEHFPEHARLIGLIIAEWSAVEFTLTWLVTFTLRPPADAIIQPMVFAIPTSRGRVAIMEAALRALLKSPQTNAMVDEIFDDAGKLLDERNHYAHAHYGISGQGNLVLFRQRLLTQQAANAATEPSLDQLNALFHRLKNLKETVSALAGKLLGLYGETLPATSGIGAVPFPPAPKTPDQTSPPQPMPPKPSPRSPQAK